MKVLVTAGGTSEPIDNVRSISNISTGKLGSLISETFSSSESVEEIIHISGKSAILPQSEKVKIFYVDDVSSLEKKLMEVFNQHHIDIIVHSMAVSDYRVKRVTSITNLMEQGAFLKANDCDNRAAMLSMINESKPVIGASGKIKSDIDDMLLLMERTPKIISLFKRASSHSILVGFKLMDGVQKKILMDAAYDLLQINKCDFVLANDLREIEEEYHAGYLIDSKRNYTSYATKKDIANGIVSTTIARWKEKRREKKESEKEPGMRMY